jgi:hypothetical protein
MCDFLKIIATTDNNFCEGGRRQVSILPVFMVVLPSFGSTATDLTA